MGAEEPNEQPPLTLRAFADSLYHGERADNYFTFLKNVPRLRDEYAPQWARDMLQEGIDAVFLTPG